jgi:hypothetical protein
MRSPLLREGATRFRAIAKIFENKTNKTIEKAYLRCFQ